jgi:hypothetical protein
VEWLPVKFKMPGSSESEIMTAAIDDVKYAFKSISQINGENNKQTEAVYKAEKTLTQALREVSELFHPMKHNTAEEQRVHIHDRPVTVREERVHAQDTPTTVREERVHTHAPPTRVIPHTHTHTQTQHTGQDKLTTDIPKTNVP